jgi:hypothetical protein
MFLNVFENDNVDLKYEYVTVHVIWISNAKDSCYKNAWRPLVSKGILLRHC